MRTIKGVEVYKEIDEEEGSTNYYWLHGSFQLWNPYMGSGWFEDDTIKTQTIIEWTRAYVGYDGLTDKEFYAGQLAIDYMANKYKATILGYNKPLLTEDVVVDLLEEVEDKYQELFKRVSDKKELEYANLYIEKYKKRIADPFYTDENVRKSWQNYIDEMQSYIDQYLNNGINENR